MLLDPENSDEAWETEVKAKNLEEAQVECEKLLVPGQLMELAQVTQRTKTPDKEGMFKFVCWFRSEA